MSLFKLNIFTPNGIVIKGLKCSSMTIPTSSGEINILPGHTHVLSELDTGILTAKGEVGDRHFSITSGLVKVLGSEVTVLSTTSESSDEIDIERAKNAKSKAESHLDSKEHLNELDHIKFQRKLHRANMRIKLAEKHKN